MKFLRLVTIAAMVSAFATASFAGSCCSKKGKKDGKAKTEQKDKAKKGEEKK